MSFSMDTPHGVLSWADGRFDGDPALVEAAMSMVAEGVTVNVTPTGPTHRAGTKTEDQALAAALAVCSLLDVTPSYTDAPDLPSMVVPPDVDL